ncbi:MAG TPA: phosphoenolpyruvate carboxylase, partial [Trueperaceae bacterium]|nr:phosphoenolpyruvate carboxylase [Trueperaceae bacterium]
MTKPGSDAERVAKHVAKSAARTPFVPQREATFEQLKTDVDFLGTALGDVLREIEGERLFDLVERVRGLTKAIRSSAGDDVNAQRRELDELLSGLELSEAEKLLRAFTVYFQLVNIAEEIHRVRVNRAREAAADSDNPRSETIAAAVKALKDQGWSEAETTAFIEHLDVQLTLTAHPTEVKRYTVRLKLERISACLRTLGERELAPQQGQALVNEIRAEISALWLTREANDERPTVVDEVKSALYYYTRSLFDAVPRLMRDLDEALETYYGPPLVRGSQLPAVVRFRSWIGGDRDGNPFVTPDSTREAYELQAAVALERYLADLDELVQRFSQHEDRVSLSTAFRDDLARLDDRHGASTRFSEEPFRRKLEHMHRLARRERNHDGEYPGGPGGYVDDLLLIETTLDNARGERLARAFVRPARFRASAFGFVLAPLDLREHSTVHEQAIASLLAYAKVHDDYAAADEDERVALLA